jgi:type 1 glutamine amidotransferase
MFPNDKSAYPSIGLTRPAPLLQWAAMKKLIYCLLFAMTLQGAWAKHIVFIIAEREYKTAETVPAYFEEHLKPLGFTGTFITAPHDGNERNDLKGLDKALEKADLVFLSVRRRAPTTAQMEAFKKYIATGKPLVGIRTASHAFDIKKDSPEGHGQWQTLDPEILGGHYNGHYSNKIESKWQTLATARNHKILEGVPGKVFTTKGSLYRVIPLESTATPLVTARAEGIDDEQPVAWTNKPASGNKVFYTSLGHVNDFENPAFVKLLTNAIHWAMSCE